MSPLITKLMALQLQAVLMTGKAGHEVVSTIATAISELQRLTNDNLRLAADNLRLTNQQKAWMAAFNDLVDQVEAKAKEGTCT